MVSQNKEGHACEKKKKPKKKQNIPRQNSAKKKFLSIDDGTVMCLIVGFPWVTL